MRGSKYVQSQVGGVYKEIEGYLRAGRTVLFSGTPCQVAGLYSSLGDIDAAHLYTIDLVCHGVPSGPLFDRYLRGLQDRYGPFSPSAFRFRRMDRWNFQSQIVREDARVTLPPRDSAFMELYLSGALFRESCYHCPFARRERIGDLTLGDFWGIGETEPFGEDPQRGCSLVLINSEKGYGLWDGVARDMFCSERSWDEAVRRNSALEVPSSRPRKRDGICQRVIRHGFQPELRRCLSEKFCRNLYARLHHQFHLVKVKLCRKSA